MTFLKNISDPSASDSELVEQFKSSGDLKILACLYQRYMEMLYGVCLKYLKDRELAKDAVMAVFEELVLKLPRHNIDYFRGWLYALAKNYCLMQLRSAKNLRPLEFDPERMQTGEELHLPGELDREFELKNMSECLETLSAEQKIAVELFYLKGKCYKEIAMHTGLEWNRIRSHIQNGRRNLKICMETKLKVMNH